MVEKKSTTGKPAPKKRAAKKVEEPKPASEVQPTVEQVNKPREINWDVIGFSSAAVTLLGAAILYIVGWTYEVNWYSFFGINMSQITISPQQVITQSFPSLITSLITFTVTFIFFAMIKNFPKRDVKFDLEEILIVSIALSSLVLVLTWIGDLRKGRVVYVFSDITPRIPGEIQITSFFVFYFLIIFFIAYAPLWFRIWTNRPLDKNLETYQVKYRKLRISILLLVTFVLMLGFGAYRGMEDAASGIRFSGGWAISKVYIISLHDLSFLGDMQQDSDLNTNKIYGPFGLVVENESSYFFIRWKSNNQEYFQRYSGLFIVPRDGLIIIPANDPSLTIITPSAIPTGIPQPTLEPTATASPTSRPTITSTSNQP